MSKPLRCPNPECRSAKVKTKKYNIPIIQGKNWLTRSLSSPSSWERNPLWALVSYFVTFFLIAVLWNTIISPNSNGWILLLLLASPYVFDLARIPYVRFNFREVDKVIVYSNECKNCGYDWEHKEDITLHQLNLEIENYKKDLARYEAQNQDEHLAETLFALGNLALFIDDGLVDAKEYCSQALKFYQQLDDQAGIADVIYRLSIILIYEENYQQAEKLLESAARMTREARNWYFLPTILNQLGTVLFFSGKSRQAESLIKEVLPIIWELDNKRHVSACLENLAMIAGSQSQPERAARLYGGADRIQKGLDLPPTNFAVAHRQQRIESTRSQIDPATWERAWEEGKAMPEEKLIEYALSGRMKKEG